MKRFAVPFVVALLAVAADQGVRPRGKAADYPAHESAGGVTIAAAIVPPEKVQHQLSAEVVKAGYTVVEVAVYPDSGTVVDVSSDDFTLTSGSSKETARADTPAVVDGAIAPDKSVEPPKTPGKVQVHTEQTIGVITGGGGYDPVTGRRNTGGVYTDSRVGVGVGDPTVGGAPPPPPPPNNSATIRDKLEQKALPEGKTTRAVAGYLFFPKVAPRVRNSMNPYHMVYSGPTGQIELTIPPK